LNESWTGRVAFEAKRLPRYAETELDFRADKEPSDIPPDRPQQKIVALVRPVETDFRAVKAGADPELEGLGCVLAVFLARGVIHG
jgi:hypothetical protein